jgi:hypothetical protein
MTANDWAEGIVVRVYCLVAENKDIVELQTHGLTEKPLLLYATVLLIKSTQGTGFFINIDASFIPPGPDAFSRDYEQAIHLQTLRLYASQPHPQLDECLSTDLPDDRTNGTNIVGPIPARPKFSPKPQT